MPDFIPGLELARSFFSEAVEPLIDSAFPQLRYGAALLGSGSEVLGFDTEMSTDHDWGPRVDLFLDDADLRVRDGLDAILREKLPRRFGGFPTSFTPADPNDHGTRLPETGDTGPVHHRISIVTARGFFQSYLAIDVTNPIQSVDWLTLPEQKLRTIAAGAVFRDEIGLSGLRDRLAYYPHDVWLYLLAAGWTRLGQEEHLVGRAGLAGDEIGSALIGARLVSDIMRLCFLMEKTYAPYPKWFGSAFQRLACAPALAPHLRAILAATSWRQREAMLLPAYEVVAALHNSLAITHAMPTTPRDFLGRPFQVIALHGFAKAIAARTTDDSVLRIVERPIIGGIDQWSDSTDVLSNPRWRAALRTLYE